MTDHQWCVSSSQQNYLQASQDFTFTPELINTILDGHMFDWDASKDSETVLCWVANTRMLVAHMMTKDGTFQSYGRSDQLLLLKNNAHLVGTYILANYFTKPSGFEQVQILLEPMHLSTSEYFCLQSFGL